jgi:hypothetical protein
MEPIEYRIMLDLQTALRQISIHDGYFHDLAGLAVKLDPNQGVEELIDPAGLRPFVVLEKRPERWEYSEAVDYAFGGTPGMDQVLLTMPIVVHWINRSDPTVDESRMQTFFRGCADVEAAVGADRTRGTLAVDTRIVQRTYDEVFDSAQVWAMVELEVRMYRTLGLPNGYPTQ